MGQLLINIFLFIILVVFMFLYWKVYFENNNIKTYIIKLLASTFFVITAIINILFKENIYNEIIILFIGLLMCFTGDSLLGLRRLVNEKKDLFMLIGFGIFFTAHIFYMIYMLNEYNGSILIFILLVFVLFAIVLIIMKLSKLSFKKLLIPSLVYALSLTTMFTLIILLLLEVNNAFSLISYIGILLFVISDGFLCYVYFKKNISNIKLVKLISIITYYLGQMLIAFSIFLK